jgi:hypothetical protein
MSAEACRLSFDRLHMQVKGGDLRERERRFFLAFRDAGMTATLDFGSCRSHPSEQSLLPPFIASGWRLETVPSACGDQQAVRCACDLWSLCG